jgi:hypothetical protein
VRAIDCCCGENFTVVVGVSPNHKLSKERIKNFNIALQNSARFIEKKVKDFF